MKTRNIFLATNLLYTARIFSADTENPHCNQSHSIYQVQLYRCINPTLAGYGDTKLHIFRSYDFLPLGSCDVVCHVTIGSADPEYPPGSQTGIGSDDRWLFKFFPKRLFQERRSVGRRSSIFVKL